MGTWRREVREWLEEHVPSDPQAVESGTLDERRAWERKLYEAGYAAIHWPREYGGRDATLAARMVFQEEYERVGAPARLNPQGLQLAGPVIMAFGTDAQKKRWLKPILTCDEIWCQGYSEPEAGSDLANLRTTGVLDKDELVVNGQKIWTSGAAHSDWMHALVRTDPNAPRHQGISYVMIDMRSPGVEVRPIKQINGNESFSEVFFTDVRVPLENVIGKLGEGWKIAMTALGFERGIGRRTYVQFLRDLIRLRDLLEHAGRRDDPHWHQEIGRLFCSTMVFRHHVQRTADEAGGGRPGPEASHNKLFWSELQTQIYEAGMKLLGPDVELGRPDVTHGDAARWQDQYWYSRATRIFAGTQQIQKNIIAERVLGLPKERRG